MRVAIKVAAVVIIIAAALLAAYSAGLLKGLFSIGEDGIRDIIDDQYPESEPDVDYVENCMVCDGNGCRTYPGPCWKVTIIEETESGYESTEILMDDSGNAKDKGTTPCEGWWCSAEPCRYSYTEQSSGVTESYTNWGCDSGLSCDAEHQRCRDCWVGSECIATVTTSSGGVVTYRFELMRTGEYAEMTSTEGICRIYSRGELIFSESMQPEECGSLMKDNTQCYDGVCDFVPEFDLIP